LKKFILSALIALCCPAVLWAQFTLQGKVTNNYNQEALAGATLSLKNVSSTQSKLDGSYQFNQLKAGTYQLFVSYIGYKTTTITVVIDANKNLNISLKKSDLIADEVIVNATRASENSATTFKNLSKADIAKNNFGQDLPYLLDQTPGVVTFSDAGAGVGYTGLRIRGSDGTRVNVTINGIPYNDTESQGTFWVNLPDFASSVDNIQIQRGVGTSTNGAGAFGGSLNIQTTTLNDSAYVEFNNSAGSYNTLKNTLNLGTGLINGKFSFDGRLSRIVSDGYIDRASSNLKSYFLSGAYYGKSSLLRLNVFSGKEKTFQAWNGIPEAKLTTDRTFNQFTYDDQTDNYQQDHYQMLYAKTLSDKVSFNGALHYTKGSGYYEEFRNDQKLANYGINNLVIGNQTITKTDLIRRRWLDNDFYGLTYSLRYQPSSKLDFTLGGAYNEYDGDHFGEVIWAQYASNSDIRERYYFDNGFKTDFNTFLKASYTLDKLSIFGDLQYRKVDYDFLGFDRNGNNVTQNVKLNFFNPKVGFTYQFNAQSNVYASFAVANKEPNRNDFTDSSPDSRPKSERLNNIELGYRVKKERVNAGINLYSMMYKNQLVLTGQVNDVGAYVRSNVAESFRNGLEIDATFAVLPKLSWGATAALSVNKVNNFVEFLDDYDNGGQVINNYSKTDLAFSPGFVGSSTLSFKPVNAFEIALLSKYVGKQYLDNTSNEARKLDAFFVNNLRLSYDFKLKGVKSIGLGLLVNNVFNELYESNGYTFSYLAGGLVTENFYYPQAETNFLFSVNMKF
jgi:iron complex outermembrane receptor protein